MAEQRVQRRLAAILAADVVGYSRMMRADETGTLAQLKTLRKEVFDPRTAEHQGRTVKTTGDGVLVEFGSAVDAVECALKIQRTLARRNEDVPEGHRFELRIGINLGDIIVDGDDIHGDGVNVAARLEGLCGTGEVYVSSTVHDQVEGKIEAAFEDLGEQAVKNIDKPIGIYRVSPEPKSEGISTTSDVEELFERPAVAVLPFENIGGDPEQEYFADGLTEDIITALSMWRSFPVIARNSTFVYKGKAVNVQELGQTLGARYVLEGSVRKVGDRVRVTAQLIDADTGHHVWAERFDRQLESVFDLQDDLTTKIAAIVAPELERAERNRLKAKRPQSLDAWHCVQRGTAHLDEYTEQGNAHAREMFERSLELDPTYGRAFAGIALSYNRDLMSGYANSRQATIDKALEAARRAIALDQSDSIAHSVLGMTFLWAGQQEEAILSFQRSLELNPSHGYARASLGNVLDMMDRNEEGISMMEAGLRLNPNAPNVRHIYSFLARAYFQARRYEDAMAWARKGIHQRPDYPNAYYILAVSLAHMGQREEARAALDQCERVQPGFVASRAEWRPYRNSADNEHFLDGLRKVGWQD